MVNTLSARVKGHIGDWYFDVKPGARSGPATVHIDPGGNTGTTVALVDAPTCGAGDVLGLQAGRKYTAKVYEGGTCQYKGRSYPSPALTIP